MFNAHVFVGLVPLVHAAWATDHRWHAGLVKQAAFGAESDGAERVTAAQARNQLCSSAVGRSGQARVGGQWFKTDRRIPATACIAGSSACSAKSCNCSATPGD